MKIGLIGARGYTGGELIKLVESHPEFELAALSSRKLEGKRARDHFETSSDLVIENLAPEDLSSREVDAWVLALPNRLSAPWVEAISPETLIVDLSSDHRFDDGWVHGFAERNAYEIKASKRIANPGCYATGMMATLWPITDLLDGPATVFGVSGFSGAGTTPSEKNDPDVLRDNLIPYAPTQHTHEKEVSHHLQHAVNFMPHVAPFFQGICLTITMTLKEGLGVGDVKSKLIEAYTGHPLINVADEAPRVRDNMGKHTLTIGGLGEANAFDPNRRRLVLNTTLDNLLKGAATQCMQNLNLASGLDALTGIPHSK